MNEHPENHNEPKLSDEQMDGLLSSFFQGEIPEQLNQLPSEWASIQKKEPTPSVVRRKVSSQRQRMIAAGASLMAACLLLFVIANPFSASLDTDPGTANVDEPVNSESILDQDATFNVSSGNNGQPIDDANTTLEEIDVIDLSPQVEDENEKERLEDQK